MKRLPAFFALRALEAAARHRSYSRAAEELSVTHSAVSQHIRTLEAELGAKLFHRKGNSMEPTLAALRLAGEVARAIDILHGGVSAFAGEVTRDPLVMSVEGFMARRWLPPRLPRLLADPAGAGLEIQVDSRHVDLRAENVDMGVRYGSGHWEGLAARRLFGERLFPVCTPAVAAGYGLRRPADLLAAPLLHRSTRPWSIWFEHFGLQAPPRVEMIFDDAQMMLEAAAQGLGVALAIDGLVDEDLKSGRLVRPFEDDVVSKLSIYMVWRPDSPKLARIHALRDWLLNEAKTAAAEGAPKPA